MDTSSSPFQAGYLIGGLVGGLLVVGGIVFFIVALVKAFTRKTKGWIITAVLTGVLGILLMISAVVVAAFNISKTVAEGRKITRQLVSKDGRHRIVVPGSWKAMSDLNEEADVSAGNLFAEQYVVVLAEAKEKVGTGLDTYSRLAADSIAGTLEQATQGEVSEHLVSGHRALRRQISGRINRLDVIYLHTCVETQEHLTQILCWTLKGRETRTLPIFEQVTATYTVTKAGSPLSRSDQVRDLIAEQIGVASAELTDASRLKEDLGTDELDLAEMVVALEEVFQVSVPQGVALEWKTVGDIIRWVEGTAK